MFLHSNNVTCLLVLTNLEHRHQSILFCSTSIDQLAEHRKSSAYQPRSHLAGFCVSNLQTSDFRKHSTHKGRGIMKHGYHAPSGLSHGKPSSKTTFLSDVNEASLSRPELNTFPVRRLLHLNAPETLIVDTGRNRHESERYCHPICPHSQPPCSTLEHIAITGRGTWISWQSVDKSMSLAQ